MDKCELLNEAFTAIGIRDAGLKLLYSIKDTRQCHPCLELLLLGQLFSLKLIALFLGNPGTFFVFIRIVLLIGIQLAYLHLERVKVCTVRV